MNAIPLRLRGIVRHEDCSCSKTSGLSRQPMFRVLLGVFLVAFPLMSAGDWLQEMEAAAQAQKQGNYAKAEKRLTAALNEARKSGSGVPTLVPTTLTRLGDIYALQGKYAEAEPLYKEALAIQEKAFGERPATADTLSHLAAFYAVRGRYIDAEPTYKRALAIREKFLGPESFFVGDTLNNLGLVYLEEGRYAEAESLLKRALAIMEKSFPPEHRYVVQSLMNVANLYYAQHKYTEAEPLSKAGMWTSKVARVRCLP